MSPMSLLGGFIGFALLAVCLYCLCAHHAKTGRWNVLERGDATGERHHGEEMQQMNGQAASDEV